MKHIKLYESNDIDQQLIDSLKRDYPNSFWEIRIDDRVGEKVPLTSVKSFIAELKAEKEACDTIMKDLETYENEGRELSIHSTPKIVDFFKDRGLRFDSYYTNEGVKIGSPGAYINNISTLRAHLHMFEYSNKSVNDIRDEEIYACNETIKGLEMYKKNHWGIGFDPNTQLTDAFLAFFVKRDLTFYMYYIRGINNQWAGDIGAYDKNIETLKNYRDGFIR